MSRFRRRAPPLLAAASGLAFSAATPPINVEPGILLGLVGFAFALGMRVDSGGTRGPSPDDAEAAPPNDRPQRFRAKQQVVSGAWRGFVFGFTANLLALRFVPEVIMRFTTLPAIAAWVALVLLSAAQALPWAVAGAIASWLSRPELRGATGSTKLVTPPFLTFAIGVYAATFVPAVFPWTPAGGLARWPVLLQTAELVGERGTSFLVSIGCGLVASAVARVLGTEGTKRERLRRGARPFGAAIAVFATLVTYGAFRMRSVDHLRDAAPHARVALLEPDFDAMFRWDERRAAMMMDRLSSLTKRAEASGAVLTVWPESAYPYTLAHGVTSAPRGARSVLQQGVRGPVLTGVYLSKGRGVGTNSAILVEPNGDIGPSYDKRHLLWFGETVPLADTFPVLARIFARGTGLAPGTESVAFRVGPITAAVLNCYEDTLPIAGREAMEARPNLLVNVTNDAWFSGSAEGELHLRLSVLRAIETRRDLVRAVNRGPTSWVGASGRVMARHDPTPGLGPSSPLLADAALLDAPVTLYTRAGDVPLLLVVALILASLSIHRRRWANHEATY